MKNNLEQIKRINAMLPPLDKKKQREDIMREVEFLKKHPETLAEYYDLAMKPLA